MSIIKIKCVDQTLTITNKPLIASGGQQENKMTFEFCSMWDGFAPTAIFYRNENEVYNVLIVNNECVIPNEVLQEEGKFYFGVFGVNGTQRRTSEILVYQVTKGAYILGQAPQEPTPNIYTQMMDLHNQVITKYNNIMANINGVIADEVLQGVVNQNGQNDLVKFWFGNVTEFRDIRQESNVAYVVTGEEHNFENAANVTDTIRGVDVYDIFECDDDDNLLPKVQNATTAESATTAETATKATILDKSKNQVWTGTFSTDDYRIHLKLGTNVIEDDSTYLLVLVGRDTYGTSKFTSSFLFKIYVNGYDAISTNGLIKVSKYDTGLQSNVTMNELCLFRYTTENNQQYLIPTLVENSNQYGSIGYVDLENINWLAYLYKIM